MKRNFVSATLALALVLPFAGTAVFAQAGDPAAQNEAQSEHRMPNPHKQAMKLGRELNLSADQTAKVEPILAERQQKVMAVRANTQLTPEQMHQQLHAIGKTTHDELSTVLTPDQMQQMKSMHHEHEHEQRQNGAAPTGA